MNNRLDSIKNEISYLEDKYKFLKMYRADDEQSNRKLLQSQKNCLLQLISKQDKLLALKKALSENF